MRFTGESVLHAPIERVWEALLDPAVLVRTIPGCERLESAGEDTYSMTVTAGVAAIRGTYSGSCVLSDLDPHQSLVMKLEGSGAPGTIGARVSVDFRDGGDGTTAVAYEADAVVGGMVGGVGQRMLTSVSRRMAGEFFGNVDAVLTGTEAASDGGPEVDVSPRTSGEGQVFTAPAAAPGQAPLGPDFLKGVAVGAGLVLLGVAAGAALGGRRR
jgi:carbon monoxide dehydrogenase subunit G